MAEVNRGSEFPIDLSDTAQVMAVLRNATHQLRLGDARVAAAEKKAAAAEERLAQATQERLAIEERLATQERLASEAREGREPTEDRGFPDIEAAAQRAFDDELAARMAEETVQSLQDRAERAEARALAVEAALAASRQRFRLTLGSVTGLALLGMASTGFYALQRPAPAPAPVPLRQAQAEPPKPSPEPAPAPPPSSVLDRLGPPRTVKTVRLSPGYDAPPEPHPAIASVDPSPNLNPTEQTPPAPAAAVPSAGQPRTPAPKPKREAAAPR